jgi:hypothetical protein
LGQHIPDRSGSSLKPLSCSGINGIDNVVEEQMPLVERVLVPGEPDRTAAILLEEVRASDIRCLIH